MIVASPASLKERQTMRWRVPGAVTKGDPGRPEMLNTDSDPDAVAWLTTRGTRDSNIGQGSRVYGTSHAAASLRQLGTRNDEDRELLKLKSSDCWRKTAKKAFMVKHLKEHASDASSDWRETKNRFLNLFLHYMRRGHVQMGGRRVEFDARKRNGSTADGIGAGSQQRFRGLAVSVDQQRTDDGNCSESDAKKANPSQDSRKKSPGRPGKVADHYTQQAASQRPAKKTALRPAAQSHEPSVWKIELCKHDLNRQSRTGRESAGGDTLDRDE
ncbi:hypothetical protein K438DRAFT_1783105 [Mycena galopus ATCC 62051]|nr:hypothetical protein K438DRAFT_1783105 [Mycena galopus ATCC 62051]